MPKVEQQIGVTVKASRNGDRRRFSIEVDAPESLFQVSDILNAHGAARSIDSILRDRTREVVTEHIKAGKDFLRNAGRAGDPPRKSHTP